MKCEGASHPCERTDAQPVPCRTSYYWEPTRVKQQRIPIEVDTTPDELAAWEAKYNPNPNTDPVLCPECAAEYNADWDEMWNEYYRGLL